MKSTLAGRGWVLVLIGLGFGVGVGVYSVWSVRPTRSLAPEQTRPTASAPVLAVASPEPKIAAPVSPVTASVAAPVPSRSSEVLSGASAPPTAAQVNEEATHHPEAPSGAVLRFSIALEHKMETALQSEAAATSLLTELDQCATDGGAVTLAESVRILCLSDAARLGEKYPALQSKFENLESRTDPRVVKLRNLMDFK